MPAKDIFHDAVRHALEKESWVITHDPLFIRYGGIDMYIDLAAEKILDTDRSFFSLKLPRRLVQRYHVHLMIYELENEVIVRWQK